MHILDTMYIQDARLAHLTNPHKKDIAALAMTHAACRW